VNCTQCGSPLAAGVAFCGSCGNGVTGPRAVAIAAPSGAPYGLDPMTNLPFSHRQKLPAGLLQIFLGGFGAGRFYTGHTGLAIAQIAATWLTCGVGGLWPLIDGILMLSGKVTDVDGKPLRD
jgi:TM2 domain-containing membrane protein YozV